MFSFHPPLNVTSHGYDVIAIQKWLEITMMSLWIRTNGRDNQQLRRRDLEVYIF